MKRMADAGAPIEAIIMACEAVEAEQNKQMVEREKAAERKRRQRERDRDVTVTGQSQDKAETTPFPAPPKDNNQTPPTHTPVNNTARARRLPTDWEPAPLPAPLLAQVSTWRCGLLESELAKFRDWAASAPAKSGLKADWDATWRNWLRRKIEEGPKNGQRGNQTDGMGSTERAARQALHELSGGAGRFDEGGAGLQASDIGAGYRTLDALPDTMRAIGHVQ